jgi:2-polyprenyl-6-methoxyphenol hydroxylase-like FAD-dependent oxidoreductase
MRISRNESDPRQAFGYVGRASILILIDRDSYWQCGYVIRKGAFDDIRSRGLLAFQRDVAEAAPFLADRTGELDSWEKVSLLTVQIDMLERWHRDGVLCIGDAAHAMSPVGGVGINLAIQDAVAAANIVYRELARGPVREETLAAVQRRRTFPTRVIQNLQVFVQDRVIKHVLRGTADGQRRVPVFLTLFKQLPVLQRIPAWLVGVGVRPEHIHTPEAEAG